MLRCVACRAQTGIFDSDSGYLSSTPPQYTTPCLSPNFPCAEQYQNLPGDLNSQLDAFGVSLFNEPSSAYAFLADVFDLHDYVMELGSTVLGSLNLKLKTNQTVC